VLSRELRLGPPLPEPVLSAFEHEHGIELPEDYRWFLAEIGNGGYGPPPYGLAPLTDALDETGAKANVHIGRRYPLTEPWVWEDEPEADPGAVDAAYEFGRIFLGTDGCGLLWVLVVAGPARGEVWSVSGEGAGPHEPRAGFLGWYAEWLAEL